MVEGVTLSRPTPGLSLVTLSSRGRHGTRVQRGDRSHCCSDCRKLVHVFSKQHAKCIRISVATNCSGAVSTRSIGNWEGWKETQWLTLSSQTSGGGEGVRVLADLTCWQTHHLLARHLVAPEDQRCAIRMTVSTEQGWWRLPQVDANIHVQP